MPRRQPFTAYFFGDYHDIVHGVDQTSQAHASDERRQDAYDILDGQETLPKRAWFVAGMGFMTDAFALFSVNAAITQLQIIYPCEVSPGWNQAGLLCATLAGTMAGQIGFGFLADRIGRRRAYGLEQVILMVSTVATAMSGAGLNNHSMSIRSWLLWWRFAMGVGIGGGYPISALNASEWAPYRQRSRLLACVFFCQALGQLFAALVAAIATVGYAGTLQQCFPTGQSTCNGFAYHTYDSVCLETVDKIWRWIVGFGAVPALLAYICRIALPETLKYTYEVNRSEQTVRQSQRFLDSRAGVEMRSNPQHSTAAGVVENGANGQPLNGSSGGRRQQSTRSGQQRRASTLDPLRLPEVPPTFLAYLRSNGNAKLLLGTAGSWCLVDCCFYGLGLHSSNMVDLTVPTNDETDLYYYLTQHIARSVALTVTGATIGSAVMVKISKKASMRTIQLYGGSATMLMLFGLGASILRYPGSITSRGFVNGPAVAFVVLSEIAFNLGPNTTTFIIPAELFATRYRGLCYGISAATGKLGALIAQLVIAGQPPDSTFANGIAFLAFGALMLVGVVWTWAFVPDTRDAHGGPSRLEELQFGREYFKRVRQERKRSRQEHDNES